MAITWLVFGEMQLGQVTAPDKDTAELEAELQFGPAFRRVQSEASWAIAQWERATIHNRLRRNGKMLP